VIEDAGFSYRGAIGVSDLRQQMQMLDQSPQVVGDCREKAQSRARVHYRWDDVVEKHSNLYRTLARSSDFSVEPRSTSTENS
jgi:hypothetical protein